MKVTQIVVVFDGRPPKDNHRFPVRFRCDKTDIDVPLEPSSYELLLSLGLARARTRYGLIEVPQASRRARRSLQQCVYRLRCALRNTPLGDEVAVQIRCGKDCYYLDAKVKVDLDEAGLRELAPSLSRKVRTQLEEYFDNSEGGGERHAR